MHKFGLRTMADSDEINTYLGNNTDSSIQQGVTDTSKNLRSPQNTRTIIFKRPLVAASRDLLEAYMSASKEKQLSCVSVALPEFQTADRITR
jgi:hypothetical protein